MFNASQFIVSVRPSRRAMLQGHHKARYTLPVSTGRVVFTGRGHGRSTPVSKLRPSVQSSSVQIVYMRCERVYHKPISTK